MARRKMWEFEKKKEYHDGYMWELTERPVELGYDQWRMERPFLCRRRFEELIYVPEKAQRLTVYLLIHKDDSRHVVRMRLRELLGGGAMFEVDGESVGFSTSTTAALHKLYHKLGRRVLYFAFEWE